MNDIQIGFLILFGVAALIAVIVGNGVRIIHEYPVNPLRWAQERRRRVEQAAVRRISALEHDLGYIPCSNDECYSCNPYPYKGIAMRASSPYNGMKKVRKAHRAPARKAV